MMKFLARMVGYVAAAMTLCAVLFSFAGTWFGKEGSVLQFARNMVVEARREQALRHLNEAAAHLAEAKSRIIAKLLGGRLSLRETIDQFQKLNEEMIEVLAIEDVDQAMVAQWLPSSTDPKRVGQNVLDWVRTEVFDWPPDKAKRLLAGLEREFRALFGGPSRSAPSIDADLKSQDVGRKAAVSFEARRGSVK